MLDIKVIKKWILSNKGLSSFFSYILIFILVGLIGNSSPILGAFLSIIGVLVFFIWIFFVLKWVFDETKKGIKELPNKGKNILDIMKIIYSDKGDTEIDKFIEEIITLDISKIHDTQEIEQRLKLYERNISIDLTEIEKRRLIKKSIRHLEIWTRNAAKDYLITEGELMVWMWFYNIISKLSDGLVKHISKKEGTELANLLHLVNKYYTIYKLTIKGEFPECNIDIALRKGEEGLFEESALLQKSKSVREMHGYSGFSTSIRITKGFSYRVGNIKPITSTKTVQYTDDIGKFIITTDRIGFIGEKQNFLIPIGKIIQFEATGNGLFIIKENSTKLYHIILDDYDIPLLIFEKLYNEFKNSIDEPKILETVEDNSYIEEISKLAKLKDDGIITEEEFRKKKEKILGI